MSLRDNYFDTIENELGAVAVWTPGEQIEVGRVFVKDDGAFLPYGRLENFFNGAAISVDQSRSLDLSSSRVRQRLLQGNADVVPAALDQEQDASLVLDFESKKEFILKTPEMQRHYIADLEPVVSALKDNGRWKHDEYYLAYAVYNVSDFYFAAAEQSAGSITLTGLGSRILDFFQFGAHVGLTSVSTALFRTAGKSGSIAMKLVRIDDDGSVDFKP